MKNFEKILIGSSIGILTMMLSPCKGFNQEVKKYFKFGTSSVFWMNDTLAKFYNGTTLLQAGVEYSLSNKLNLGYNIEAGSKKTRNKLQKTNKINLFSANIESNIEVTTAKKFSLYTLIGMGISSLEEKDNNGSTNTKCTSIGTYLGPGIDVKIGKKISLFGEIKKNFNKTISYLRLSDVKKPIIKRDSNLNNIIGNFGIKLRF